MDKCQELLGMMSEIGYEDEEVRGMIRKRPKAEMVYVTGDKDDTAKDGFTIPLNIFLYQEVARLNFTIQNVRTTLADLVKAIRGEIIMTPELQEALKSIFNGKPPVHWYTDPSGATIAWTMPSLALWFNGLLEREEQLSTWLTKYRPICYWLTGFFNPQGFLTAMRQEVTRRHKHEKWALDDVSDVSEVTEFNDYRHIKRPRDEGVYIYGLFLEGASWGYTTDKKEKLLTESHPKELFTPLPVLYVTAASGRNIRLREAEAAKNADRKTYNYECPVYTKPMRTDLSYVFKVKLKSDVHEHHWIMRGVSILCSIN